MSTEHIVQEGEHLAGIAAQHGFSSIHPIWDHPENAALKAKRKNPNILLAGDRLFIPDREAKDVEAATERRHRFVASVERLELRVKVHNQGFQPIHGEAKVVVGADKTSMTQAGDIFEAPLRPDVKAAVLEFPLVPTQRLRPSIPIEVGRLDPLDTLSGQQQRLNNLGYFAGFKKTTATDPKKADEQFRWAVEEFQCDHMGPTQVDGVLGSKTLQKLKEVYGS